MLVSEWCQNCDTTITVEWNIKEKGIIIYCPSCGKKLVLCSMCEDIEECITTNCKYKKKI